jgi:hypothetical protein
LGVLIEVGGNDRKATVTPAPESVGLWQGYMFSTMTIFEGKVFLIPKNLSPFLILL